MPQPHKRPKASFVRFEAQLPNELWQTDATEWRLADDSKVEILNLIDDHSRLCLASIAVRTVKAADALQTFYSALEEYGPPARFFSDAVFSGKSRRGRVALESELDRLGIECVHSTPYHPQTCGKVDRFGRVTLRHLGRLHHIGLGLAYKNRPIRLLVDGDHVRVVTEEGSLLRELTLDPSRDYQRLGSRKLFHDVVRQASGMS